MNIILKKEAIKLKQKWYYTGIICKNGHLDKRYVNTGICYECKRIQNKSCNNRNPERLKKSTKKSYILNKEKKLKSSKKWTLNNRKRSNEIKNNWKKRNRKKYLKYCREYAKRKRLDPYYRLSKNVSKAIWCCLKNNKKQLTWTKYVDYNLNELIDHLEKQFTNKMNWDNYGTYWHVDHKKPLSWFNLKREFKEAWSLNNLQPLEAKINLSKNNRYESK